MSGFNLSAFAVRERSLTLFLILAITVAGVFALFQLGRAEDPSFKIKVMTVSLAWPGATTEEMQRQVADPIERRLQELEKIDFVETAVRPGTVTMRLQLRDEVSGTVVDDQFYQARKKVIDELPKLPAGVAGPFLNDEYGDVYFAIYALQARGMPYANLVQEAERLRQTFLAVPGVEQVNLIGEQRERIYVEFARDRLATLGLTPAQVLDALARANAVTPSGAVETQSARVSIRVREGFVSLDDVRAVPLVAGDRTLTIGDVTTVRRGLENPPSYLVRFNGEPAIQVGVVMRARYNGLDLGRDLEHTIEKVGEEMPLGLSLTRVVDQAENIAHAIDLFMEKFVVALAVVLLVSFLSLGFRIGLVVAAAVPLTLAAVFVIMLVTDRDLDRITLGALILSLGLLVDDAIIAIEMMVVKMQEGMDRVKAASYAWTSTAFPMLSGTLVTVIGFLPVGFAQSTSGEYAGNIFWIVAFALLISWVVAVYFTPYLGVKMLPRIAVVPGGHEAIYRKPMYERLRSWVRWSTHHRALVISGTLVLLALSGGGLVLLEKQFFPTSERPEVLVELTLPQGSGIENTQVEVERVEAMLREQPETLHVSSYVGAGAPRFFLSLNPELPNPAFAKLLVMTKNPKERDVLRQRIQAMFDRGNFPAVRGRATQLVFGPPVPFPVRFRVMGPDAAEVRRIASDVRALVAANLKTHNAHLEWAERSPRVTLTFDQQRLNQIGLTRQEAGLQVQALLSGVTATQVREGTRTVDVVIRGVDSDRRSLSALESLTLITRDGQPVPLTHAATLTPATEEPVLWRRNRDLVISVQADVVDGVQPPDVTGEIQPAIDKLRQSLAAGYRIETSGSVEESAKANAALFAVFPVMLLLMLLVIMIQVRSFPKMMLVLATAPLGLIGAVAALLLADRPFGFTAILGLIGIGGILMRNTLILIDEIDQDLRHGADLTTAVIESTVRRARPVVLTALAAMLAFIPLTQSTFWGGLALVLIGGVAAGTALTLVVLPAAYVLVFQRRRDSTPAQAEPAPDAWAVPSSPQGEPA